MCLAFVQRAKCIPSIATRPSTACGATGFNEQPRSVSRKACQKKRKRGTRSSHITIVTTCISHMYVFCKILNLISIIDTYSFSQEPDRPNSI